MSKQIYNRIPKGYTAKQYPLHHNFQYLFELSAEHSTKKQTMISLIRSSLAATGSENVEVNPKNAAFVEETGPTIFQDSIIPRMTVSFSAHLTKGAIETDNVRSLTFNWMPIYVAFLDDLEATDKVSGLQIEDILELQHDTTNEDVYPLFDGNDVDGIITHPLSTVTDSDEAFGDFGLTTNSVLEHIAFDKGVYFDARKYYTNKEKLAKVAPRLNTGTVYRDRPYRYSSSNYTHPTVKRGNPYTFCGILFSVPQVATADQASVVAGDTTAIGHIRIGMNVRYDEWNSTFDQGL